MFFEFCNTFEIFQSFINNDLREYLNDFCFNYFDDIFISSNSKKKHIEHVKKILKRLEKINFFLNIDKCEFFVIFVKYLNLIIIIDDVKMNFQKIEIIVNWKSSKYVKNVQTFLNFVNFYKKFIFDYFRLTISLNKLIKIIEIDFAYSWNFDNLKKTIFKTFKLIFITISIFQHFNSNFETWIEINVSNWIIVAIFSQRDIDEQFHFVTYMSKKMSFVECNYEIYDKKFLTIIRIFEKWKSKCVEISMKNSIKYLIDHKNLKHFRFFKQFNRKQIKWIEFLTKFNFKIAYKFDVQKTKFDNLIRKFQNFFENNENEKQRYNYRILFKIHYLKFEIRKTIKMTSIFINKRKKTITSLIVMLYELNEKKFKTNEKSTIESFAKKHLENDLIKKNQ